MTPCAVVSADTVSSVSIVRVLAQDEGSFAEGTVLCLHVFDGLPKFSGREYVFVEGRVFIFLGVVFFGGDTADPSASG